MSRRARRCALALLAVLLLPVAGCRFTTRHLPVPKAPAAIQTATPDQLVDQLNRRWDAIQSMYANVEIQASTLNPKQGVEKDYTTFPAIIMMRKPEMLMVYGEVPVIKTQMFRMATDGLNFTLYIPSRDLAYQGPNTLTKPTTNTIENMRPGFFFDALIVRGVPSEDLFMRTADTETIEDAAHKHLYTVPEYTLSILRHTAGSRNLTPVRVVTFHRDDLLPYQQDLYDPNGNLETEVQYSKYADFGGNRYPASVTIKRPQEQFQIVLTVDNVVENPKNGIPDDQFQIKLPPNTKVQHLE